MHKHQNLPANPKALFAVLPIAATKQGTCLAQRDHAWVPPVLPNQTHAAMAARALNNFGYGATHDQQAAAAGDACVVAGVTVDECS